MNFLALTKRLHLLLRIGEESPGSRPLTVTGQTGVLGEMVEWIKAANDDILRLHLDQWLFLKLVGEFTLAQGGSVLSRAQQVAAIPTLGALQPFTNDESSYVLCRPNDGTTNLEQTIEYIPYQRWFGGYDMLPLADGQPQRFTIAPNGDMQFDAYADRPYIIRTNYRAALLPLTTDNDVPLIPEDAHALIVWWAIVRYYCATRDGTREMREKANVEMNRELTALRNRWLPSITL